MANGQTATAPAEPKTMTEQQWLARSSAQAPIVITTPEQYATSLTEWQKHYNVLTPFTSMVGIAPSHGLIATIVKIDTDPTKGEVYSGYLETGAKGMPFLKGDRGKDNEEFAIAKIGLRKLAECGAISTDANRLDNGLAKNYWYFKGTGTYRGLDGSLITRSASFDWDLREGSDRMKGWQPNQVSESRKNGLRNCEARAINAAIRECGCGIKQKYTRAELDRPFLVVRVAFLPDMADPEIKRMVTAQALGSVHALYPGTSREAAPEGVIDAEVSPGPKRVGGGTAAAETKQAEDEPPTPDAVRITKVHFKDGATNGKPWRKFIITDSTGTEHTTFDKRMADYATGAVTSKVWVEIAEEQNGQYRNLIEIAPAGQQPSLPDPGNL